MLVHQYLTSTLMELKLNLRDGIEIPMRHKVGYRKVSLLLRQPLALWVSGVAA